MRVNVLAEEFTALHALLWEEEGGVLICYCVSFFFFFSLVQQLAEEFTALHVLLWEEEGGVLMCYCVSFSFSSLLYNFFLFLKEVREEGAAEDAAKVRVCV